MRLPNSRILNPLLLPLIIISIQTISAHQEVLFDLSKQGSDLKWDQLSMRHDRDDVWMEETWRNPAATDEKHANQRAYVTCNYDMINPSNWLFTHFVNVQQARRVYIELLFNTRDCDAYLNPKSCKETFSVYLRQFSQRSNSTRMEKERFAADQDNWKNIGRLARSNSNMTTETIGMEVDAGTKWIRIAFEEQGICLSLLNVKIYYRVCDEFTDQLVHFPTQVTGRKETDMVRMNGSCIPNASKKIAGVDLIGLCMSTGSGIKTSGECVCDSGYSELTDSTGARCESCPPNTYKPKGQDSCRQCPSNSISGEAASSCRCVTGYYRADDELVSAPCTQPPSRPIKLTASAITASSARLSWNEPSSLGGRPEIWYEVRCSGRGECGTVVMTPGDKRLSTRSVQINGLRPASDYTFLVYARNKVSSQFPEFSEKNAVIDIRTRSEEEDVPPVSHLRVDAAQSDGLTISWSVADSDISDFEVEVRPAVIKKRAFETRHVNQTYTTFIGLRQDTVYQFRVRIRDDLRWSHPISYQLGKGILSNTVAEVSESSQFLNQTGSALLIIIALILVVIAVALCMIVVQKKSKNRKQMSDLDVLDTYKQDSMTPDYHTSTRHHHGGQQGNLPGNLHEQLRSTTKLNAPLIPSFGSPISQPPPYYGGVQSSGKYKTYVDPTTYEDPYQALIEFTFDISPQDVFITQVIGGGEFGDVCLGGLSRNSPACAAKYASATMGRTFESEQYETVAIKTLKSGSSAKAKAEFLTEATIMGQFSHPNVIRLIGVVTSAEPVMIVAEYMANGSLDQYLRTVDQRGEKVAWEKITEMLYGIASGMKYLTDMGYVHRDLAARNVLLDQELRCKIADFGLSRGVRSEGSVEPEYTTNGGKIPVRWTAPEAITHRKFTPSSDVWSFGVVIWEVCSFGERPYWDWTNQKVISEVMIGYRLPPPMECPMGLYRVAQWCWRMERHERPTFTQLLATFHKLILQPTLIEQDPGELPKRVQSHVALNTYGSIPPTPPSSAAPMPSLDDFLRQIGLNHVYGKLVSNNIHSVSDLAATSHLDLLACGLISPECSIVRDGLNGRMNGGTIHATTRGTRTTRPPREEGFFV
uniref:receptor protein-tyrosine kinase n=1 Tax=Caenorhabditis tropicalis TaxID=1561998 RepID=A0A1I7U5K8_9PELO